MGTEIIPHARTRPGRFAPPRTHLRAETIKVGFKVENLTEPTLLDHRARSKELTIPAAVLKYRKKPFLFQCQLGELRASASVTVNGLSITTSLPAFNAAVASGT